jgi:hypothetical protein
MLGFFAWKHEFLTRQAEFKRRPVPSGLLEQVPCKLLSGRIFCSSKGMLAAALQNAIR